MSARHWMIGCVLGLAGIGSAVAADMDSRDVVVTSHEADSSASRDAGSSSGGDVLGLNRDCPSSRHAAATSADNGNEGSSDGTTGGSEHAVHGGSAAPATTRRPHLGWQSLLPGSIQ